MLTTDHPKVLRARNGILPEGVMRRIEAMIAAAEAEHPDDELKQLLRTLVPDFHPHPPAPNAQPPLASGEERGDRSERGDRGEISILRA